MNRFTTLAGAAAVFVLCGTASGARKPEIRVEERTLPNGMKWLFYENHQSPTITGGWVAHVGSVNEREGITGISHLFEHMMFKGTHVIGTTNIAVDLQNIEAQEKIQDEMRAEMALMREKLRRGEIDDLQKPENQSAHYKDLEARFGELVKKQRETIVKEELEQIYTKNGAEALNASTTEDFTLYFVRIPKNRVELWAWLESDRLLNRVFREFYSERDVVYEERRRSVEARPLGKYDEAFNALFWEAHPYKWPVLGWPSDLATISKAEADAYFGVHYAPNNLTGVMAGDFSTAEIWPLVSRYFGRIPTGKVPPPEVVTLEPRQLGEKRFNATAETSPTVRIWWHAPPFVHKDRPALELLADILSGRTGRLFKGLVLSRKVANQASADLDAKKYAGSFEVEVMVKDGTDPAAVEKAIYEEIGSLQKTPPPEEELQKVKNETKADAYRRLSSTFFIALQLMAFDGLGDWKYINTSSEATDSVAAADITRVASAYLTKENRTVGVFLRAPGAGPADAEVEALPAEVRGMISQGLEQIRKETDPAQLRQGILQMQQEAAHVPPEMKPAIDLMLRRAKERLAALEAEKKSP
jgi:predicted Zn-dependent peptidase